MERWRVIIQKVNTYGQVTEERVSLHEDDETATDALLAASEAAMEYEADFFSCDIHDDHFTPDAARECNRLRKLAV
jgi:hypothetical protein